MLLFHYKNQKKQFYTNYKLCWRCKGFKQGIRSHHLVKILSLFVNFANKIPDFRRTIQTHLQCSTTALKHNLLSTNAEPSFKSNTHNDRLSKKKKERRYCIIFVWSVCYFSIELELFFPSMIGWLHKCVCERQKTKKAELERINRSVFECFHFYVSFCATNSRRVSSDSLQRLSYTANCLVMFRPMSRACSCMCVF